MAEGGNSGGDGLLFISENDGDTVVKGIGFESAGELVGRAGIPDEDSWEMRGIAQDVIDYARYIVTVRPKSCVVSIWWRKTETIARWVPYLKADETFRR